MPELARSSVLVVFAALVAVGLSAQTPPETSVADEHAKNVILFIGDGVDVHQLTIARSYLYGLTGSLSFDQFPYQASARVRTVSEKDGTTPVYVADSASAGSSIASGIVTSRGRISTTAKTDRDVPTILELAQQRKKNTGIVTTASITDATPAVFMAHTSMRFCEGPKEINGTREGLPGCPKDAKSEGGFGSIAEQIVSRGVDVLLGGGTRFFSQRGEDGSILIEQMTRSGYVLVTSAAELAALHKGSSSKVLGLFGNKTLPAEWWGADGRSSEAVRIEEGKAVFPEPFSCEPNPRFGKRPTLAAMTRFAIEALAARSSDDGFFLMVESASIDKQAHAMNPCGQIGEVLALSDAVQIAASFAEGRGDTLVLVTSDHGHAPQIIPHPSLFSAYAPSSKTLMYPAGRVALLKPESGGTLAISYGTNAHFLEEHTGTQVPVFAMGPGASPVRGLMDQTEIFHLMVKALGE